MGRTRQGHGKVHPDGSITVDRRRALQVLEEEVRAARQATDPGPWADRVVRLVSACEGRSLTLIAMLGTALLAKATHIEIDPFALKRGLGTPGAYSARGLCQHVLAAHAPRLGIDLGVTGREPLNNQPFFAKDRVHKDLPVHESARAAFEMLLTYLKEISEFSTEEEARAALRGFLFARRVRSRTLREDLEAAERLTPSDLVEVLSSWVSENSEYGKRAQAAAAGLLDVLAGHDRVRVGRIHDPDRRFPGDVAVLLPGQSTTFLTTFEVRDKPVSETDLYHVVRKALEVGVRRVAVFAVAEHQEDIDLEPVSRWAWDRGALLTVYTRWSHLVADVLQWSSVPVEEVVARALERVLQRAQELEVSEDGLRALVDAPLRVLGDEAG